ncbi:MAG: SpoIID/LytB domain-containing protein [Elusimicrobiota bacterium]|nr:SpoIID/LytB domain-containing protein [Elusimicrobiota bacterium]
MRVYSLHKTYSVTLSPANGGASAGGRPLGGQARARARGSSVVLDGALKAGPEKNLRVLGAVWLSGSGLPRRLYRGELVFTSQKNLLRIINTVPLETYLAGVVTGEAGDLSHPEAYKAQAVTARSYTVKHMNNHSGEGYNMCDSTHCQLYTGLGAPSARALAASGATRGEMLLYRGEPAAAFYHSVCGGRTEDMTFVWPYEYKPYLVSVRDGPPGRPYCSIAPGFAWKTKIYFTGLTRLGRRAGWLVPDEEARGMRISAWGASGRAAEIEIYTQRRRVKVTATDFYHGIGRRAGWQGVRSSYFKILSGKDYVLLDGVGNGHGVGMCQWGAEGMARKGFKYRDILRHYYPGTEVRIHD